MKIDGKNILLTGGSLGIGKETTKALVEKGANVLITGRSEDRLKKAAEYSGAIYIVFDISDLDIFIYFLLTYDSSTRTWHF